MLVRHSSYYPLPIFQVGRDKVATSPREMKRDFRTLGILDKGSGAQAVFSSVLPAAGNDEGRNGKSQQINTWLIVCVTSRILVFLIKGQSAQHEAC